MKRLFVILCFVGLGVAVQAQPAIGEWQDHNSFVRVYKVCATPDRVYAATRMAMFYFDRNSSKPVVMTKVSGLTDVGISTIAYDEVHDGLVVAYLNSGIDLIYDEQIYHVADIRYGNISGDKQIYNIRYNSDKVYFPTGFGIVMMYIARHEIKETYDIV